MSWHESSISEVALEISACLNADDSSSALRLAFRFIERFNKSDLETRAQMAAQQPGPTGSLRFDALLAGIVEFSFASHGVTPPTWVDHERFFLNEFWFVSGLTSLHADALAHGPISLARRGVFVTQDALTYA
ncbi:MAG: hypothetical protein ACYC1I_12395 [Acidimicrobiales bacterium]